MDADRAGRLRDLMTHDGWRDFMALAHEYVSEREEYLIELMTTPDKLTGKTAIAKANQRKGVRDLIEEVERAKKISPQPARAGA